MRRDALGEPDAKPSTSDARNDATSVADAAATSPNPIVLENRRAGTDSWEIRNRAARGEIEGYASAASARPGDSVNVQVNVSVAGPAKWELFRLGDYGGFGARLVSSGDLSDVAPQSPCGVDATTGLVECQWKPTFSVVVDATWLSGQYLFKLTRSDGFESYVPLLVREAVPRAPILFQSSVTTWQAYNSWGGASLYLNAMPAGSGFTGKQASRVSFDRPYEYARPSRESQPEIESGAGQLFLSEIWMLRWLEAHGYDVAYVTNVDIDADPGLLGGRGIFLDVGHDEYWSAGERAGVDAARSGGLSIAFFSANDAYWKIRLEASSTGVPRRIVTCYKHPSLDPQQNEPGATGRWNSFSGGDPEAELVGVTYGASTNLDAFPLVVSDPSHWVYEGTGIRPGDTLSHVVGYEWDGFHALDTQPKTLEIVASTPTVSAFGVVGIAEASAYYPTPSSFVFAAGTVEWPWGLGKPGYRDFRVEKITANVLARANELPVTPIAPDDRPSATDSANASKVALVAGTGLPGHVDGPASTALFDSPAGVATDGLGVIYVTEAHNHAIRVIALDGTVSTLAGCGPDGQARGSFADGTGIDACFNAPTGVAVGPDGTVYVTDTGNRRIRAVTKAGVVTTFAGTGDTPALDGPRASAQFDGPRGLAFGPDGALYVADYHALRKIQSDKVTTLAPATELTAVAVAADGAIYVLETSTGSIDVLDNGALRPIVNVGYNFGDLGGPGSRARLRPVEGLVADRDALIVSDTANYKLRLVSLTSKTFAVSTLVGDGRYGSELGSGATTRLVNPRGLALTPTGILVADSANHRILRVTR